MATLAYHRAGRPQEQTTRHHCGAEPILRSALSVWPGASATHEGTLLLAKRSAFEMSSLLREDRSLNAMPIISLVAGPREASRSTGGALWAV
jgi:hypothetical protein